MLKHKNMTEDIPKRKDKNLPADCRDTPKRKKLNLSPLNHTQIADKSSNVRLATHHEVGQEQQ
jgi:hypothetical protein